MAYEEEHGKPVLDIVFQFDEHKFMEIISSISYTLLFLSVAQALSIGKQRIGVLLA